MFVVRYNVRRILAGDPAPSVQISVHPISSEGIWLLEPLLDCNDPLIREGIRALLATRDIDSESLAARRATQGWTSFQLADQLLVKNLRGFRRRWSHYSGPGERAEALERFHAYAYKWF